MTLKASQSPSTLLEGKIFKWISISIRWLIASSMFYLFMLHDAHFERKCWLREKKVDKSRRFCFTSVACTAWINASRTRWTKSKPWRRNWTTRGWNVILLMLKLHQMEQTYWWGPPAGGVQTALAGSRPHDDGGLSGRREPHYHFVAGWQQQDQFGEFLALPPQAGSGSKLWLDVQKVLTKNCELDKEFTLRCDRHHQQTVKVRNAIEILWRKFN